MAKINFMKKHKPPLLNDIIDVAKEIYEFAPTFWNWAIVLTSIYILLKN